jgi:hypothetical protein
VVRSKTKADAEHNFVAGIGEQVKGDDECGEGAIGDSNGRPSFLPRASAITAQVSVSFAL